MSVEFMGASKRCFGARGVFRKSFGGFRNHMERFEENRKRSLKSIF